MTDSTITADDIARFFPHLHEDVREKAAEVYQAAEAMRHLIVETVTQPDNQRLLLGNWFNVVSAIVNDLQPPKA